MKSSGFLPGLLLCLLLFYQCRCQVTFSRDWNAGKRAGSQTPGIPSDCSPYAHQSIILCQMLLSEIHHLTACEVKQSIQKRGTTHNVDQIFRAPVEDDI